MRSNTIIPAIFIYDFIYRMERNSKFRNEERPYRYVHAYDDYFYILYYFVLLKMYCIIIYYFIEIDQCSVNTFAR